MIAVVASVAPGHDDRAVRPWNKLWRRDRLDGKYYSKMWSAATAAPADAVFVNSFNGWAEGTQIESAQADAPKPYLAHAPSDRYITATAELVAEYERGQLALQQARDEL